jgi:hypothetical protein
MKFYFEPLIDFDPNTSDSFQKNIVTFGHEIKKSWKYDLNKAGLYCSWRDIGFSIRESRDHALRYTDYFDEVL